MIIVYPPTIDWNWMKQRPQQLMSRLARRGHTVFFCNPTWAAIEIEEIEPRLYVIHQYERWVREEWPAYRQTACSHVPIVVWCSFPKLASELAALSPDHIIYDCVDEFAEWLPYEAEMVRIADAVICTSERLFARMERCYPMQKISLIRNGYDIDMGLHVPEVLSPSNCSHPLDLPERGLKRAAYIGAWAPWVDDLLLLRLVETLKELEVVIIGPEFGKRFRVHSHHDRIRFLGLKSHQELNLYLRHASVLLLPFRIQPLTLSTNPVKLYEYLATGKPVVSTALPEALRLQPEVDVAASAQAFVARVKHRLYQPGEPDPRIAVALDNTWEQRAAQAEAVLESL